MPDERITTDTDDILRRLDRAYAEGYRQACREWSACADVPNRNDKARLDQRYADMAKRWRPDGQ